MKPKKKPFRITGPGLYRTRDGRKVTVSKVYRSADPYPVWGRLHDDGYNSWERSGRFISWMLSDRDIVSRWPGKKARRK